MLKYKVASEKKKEFGYQEEEVSHRKPWRKKSRKKGLFGQKKGLK